MPSDVASTLGWDTVFAAHIADLNEVIAARKVSPTAFSASDAEDAISVTGIWNVANRRPVAQADCCG